MGNKTGRLSTEVELETGENSSPFEINSAIPDTMEQLFFNFRNEIEAGKNSSSFEIYSAIPDTMEQVDITDIQLSMACNENTGKLQNCGQYFLFLPLWIEL